MPREREVSLPSALTHLSLSLYLSLSLCICKVLRFQLKHRNVASLILHASIAEITAQLLFYLLGSLFQTTQL